MVISATTALRNRPNDSCRLRIGNTLSVLSFLTKRETIMAPKQTGRNKKLENFETNAQPTATPRTTLCVQLGRFCQRTNENSAVKSSAAAAISVVANPEWPRIGDNVVNKMTPNRAATLPKSIRVHDHTMDVASKKKGSSPNLANDRVLV